MGSKLYYKASKHTDENNEQRGLVMNTGVWLTNSVNQNHLYIFLFIKEIYLCTVSTSLYKTGHSSSVVTARPTLIQT